MPLSENQRNRKTTILLLHTRECLLDKSYTNPASLRYGVVAPANQRILCGVLNSPNILVAHYWISTTSNYVREKRFAVPLKANCCNALASLSLRACKCLPVLHCTNLPSAFDPVGFQT